MNLQQQQQQQSPIPSREPFDDRQANGIDIATLKMRDRSMMPLGRGVMSEERYTQRLSIPSRPRAQTDRIELPSIRQAVPEIELPERPTDLASYSPRTTRIWESPSEEPSVDAYGKRRRLSRPEERSSEPRDYPVARAFPSPTQARAQSVNPSPAERQTSGFFSGESWSTSNREAAYGTPVLPAMRLTPRFDSGAGEARLTLPSLPSLTLERAAAIPSVRSPLSDYVLDASRSSPPVPQYSGSGFRASQTSSFGNRYGYVKPRGQSLSDLTMHPQGHSSERPLYAPRGYFQDRHDMHELGAAVEGTKNRKRRGNLPKETTDKLRAWFVAHLHHPYPTEDEKQDLMRQTKLQMNQISNWFINARRRQLPAMINNARVESDARSARSAPSTLGEGSLLGGADREMSDEEKRNMEMGLGLSYGTMGESGSEGDGGYEDSYDNLDRTRSAEGVIY